MSELVQPIRFSVYDKDQKYLGYIESKSAKLDINPDTVRTKIDELVDVMETGLNNISSAICNEAEPDAENSLVIVDTETTEIFTQVNTFLTDGSIISSVSDSLETVYEAAVSSHNQIQTAYNDAARDAAKAVDNYSYHKETNISG